RGRLLEFSRDDGAGEAVLLPRKTKNRFARRGKWSGLSAGSLRSLGGRAFAAQRRRFRFFFFAGGFFHAAGKIAAGNFTAADHGVSGGHGNVDPCSEAIDAISADRKPAPGVEQIADVFADVSELQALDRAVVSRGEIAFVSKSQRGAGIFAQRVGQRHAHRVLLAETLHRQFGAA